MADPQGLIEDMDELEDKYRDREEGAQVQNLLISEARVAKKFSTYKLIKLWTRDDCPEDLRQCLQKIKNSLEDSWTKKEYQTVVNKSQQWLSLYRNWMKEKPLTQL